MPERSRSRSRRAPNKSPRDRGRGDSQIARSSTPDISRRVTGAPTGHRLSPLRLPSAGRRAACRPFLIDLPEHSPRPCAGSLHGEVLRLQLPPKHSRSSSPRGPGLSRGPGRQHGQASYPLKTNHRSGQQHRRRRRAPTAGRPMATSGAHPLPHPLVTGLKGVSETTHDQMASGGRFARLRGPRPPAAVGVVAVQQAVNEA